MTKTKQHVILWCQWFLVEWFGYDLRVWYWIDLCKRKSVFFFFYWEDFGKRFYCAIQESFARWRNGIHYSQATTNPHSHKRKKKTYFHCCLSGLIIEWNIKCILIARHSITDRQFFKNFSNRIINSYTRQTKWRCKVDYVNCSYSKDNSHAMKRWRLGNKVIVQSLKERMQLIHNYSWN